jgi:CRP-like cAMP-binding protein
MENCRILLPNQEVEKYIKLNYFEKFPKRYLKKNEICFPCNDRILFVKKGKIKIITYKNEKEITLYYLNKNNIAFCSEENVIKAKEKSELYFIPINEIGNYIDNINLYNLILKEITEKNKIERELIHDLAFTTCSERAINFLITTADKIGKKTEKGIEVELNCSIDEFANFLGTTRQTLSTFINILIKKNLLEKHHKVFIIKDIDSLRNFKL